MAEARFFLARERGNGYPDAPLWRAGLCTAFLFRDRKPIGGVDT
jgi:hypothetical protein